MKPPEQFVRVVNRVRYSVAGSTLLADDAFWDGHNFERHGRNRFLYRSPKGKYFQVTLTQWQGEQDTLIPLSLDEAIALYEELDDKNAVPFEKAFPKVNVEDA